VFIEFVVGNPQWSMRRLLVFGLIGFAAQLIDGALGMA